jgi:penicillin-binding protein 1A
MSRRQRQQRRRRTGRGGGTRFLAVTAGILIAVIGLAVLGVVGYVIGIAASAPNIDSLKPIDKGAVSVVYAANGERLGFIESDEVRTPIPGSQIPQPLKDATIAIEDSRYYKHKGVDYQGVVRAAIKNLRSGKTVQGGSTITMQLVRNLYISQERTFARKIREAKLAQELEDRHSKRWILDEYLNDVPYGTVGGRTAIGAESGARTFFDKEAKDLTLPEAALLAGLPQAPSLYNPFLAPRAARERRAEVLDAMLKQRMITPAQAAAAKASPLGVKQNNYYTAKKEGYFFDYVKSELIEKYGINTVRRGGLKIYTTIEPKLQDEARQAIAGRLYESGDPASAIVSIDPKTGYIRAMASSVKYGDSQFNLAAQGRRQPGSTFKVMVLMTALRKGVDPNSTYYTSRPLDLQTEYGPWKVSTYSNSYGGSMNLVSATLQSDNTVYAQLDLDVGPDAVKQTAKDLGITTKLDGYPAEGLGGLTKGVSPLEMANAYATIANGGWRNKPIAIKKIVFPDGRTVDSGKPQRDKKFRDGTTYEAIDILRQNIQRGTGTAAAIGCPAAGKTGTTDSFNDAWFVGFTPKLATSVWVGYPKAQIEMRSVHGISVAGGTFPAEIWHDYMSKATEGEGCPDFASPKESADLSAYFGRYSGGGDSGSSDSGGGSTDSGTTDENQGTTGGQQNGGRYPSGAYESPPQGAPQTQAPPPTPQAPSGGGGGGGGSTEGGGLSPG